MFTSPAIDYKTKKEEIWNAFTHGVAFIASIPIAILIIIFTSQTGAAVETVAMSIYASAVMLLFGTSTLLHSVPVKWKHVCSIIDHSAIYVLIAGSYTPILLLAVGTPFAHFLLATVWLLAVAGIVFKCFFVHRYETFSLIMYIAMGWLVLFVMKPLIAHIGWGGFSLLVAGGLFYTVGAIFYAWQKLPYNHAIWHVFVIFGCSCMTVCIFFFL